MEKLHFQAKSAANFVKLGCTILFEKGNRMDDLGAEEEAQLEYIKQWRERKRKKEDRRKGYWMEAVWHLRMFFDMLFKFIKG